MRRCRMVHLLASAWVVTACDRPPAVSPESADPGGADPSAAAAGTASAGSPPAAGAGRSERASQPSRRGGTSAPAASFEPLELDEEQLRRAKKIQRYVAAASAQYDVDPNLINGIIWTESKFNAKAHNRSGAKGLMQLMPKTSRAMAQKIGKPNRPYDPQFSVTAGAYLLSRLLEKFDGDEELALFGYARGSGTVRGWQSRGETEIPEGVQKFIARVRRAQATFERLGFPNPPG